MLKAIGGDTQSEGAHSGKVMGDHIDFTRDNGRGPVMFTAKKVL